MVYLHYSLVLYEKYLRNTIGLLSNSDIEIYLIKKIFVKSYPIIKEKFRENKIEFVFALIWQKYHSILVKKICEIDVF